MAYQLQPDLVRLKNPAVPEHSALDYVFTYPQASSLNYVSSRPNTVLYGTSPYMAGKGSPAEYIETSDELRPQTTTQFGKITVDRYEKNLFPVHKTMPPPPLPRSYDPVSSRADLQNNLFDLRYNKNINN
uniref:Uncharacterized protein n=1 Tax=viral metagenome TaxID=1070528 RepID=A0A6C0JT94_9ZZZZ